MARQAKNFKNLNCKVDKEVSDLLEKAHCRYRAFKDCYG